MPKSLHARLLKCIGEHGSGIALHVNVGDVTHEMKYVSRKNGATGCPLSHRHRLIQLIPVYTSYVLRENQKPRRNNSVNTDSGMKTDANRCKTIFH